MAGSQEEKRPINTACRLNLIKNTIPPAFVMIHFPDDSFQFPIDRIVKIALYPSEHTF